jgi:hypothetical protein
LLTTIADTGNTEPRISSKQIGIIIGTAFPQCRCISADSDEVQSGTHFSASHFSEYPTLVNF